MGTTGDGQGGRRDAALDEVDAPQRPATSSRHHRQGGSVAGLDVRRWTRCRTPRPQRGNAAFAAFQGDRALKAYGSAFRWLGRAVSRAPGLAEDKRATARMAVMLANRAAVRLREPNASEAELRDALQDGEGAEGMDPAYTKGYHRQARAASPYTYILDSVRRALAKPSAPHTPMLSSRIVFQPDFTAYKAALEPFLHTLPNPFTFFNFPEDAEDDDEDPSAPLPFDAALQRAEVAKQRGNAAFADAQRDRALTAYASALKWVVRAIRRALNLEEERRAGTLFAVIAANRTAVAKTLRASSAWQCSALWVPSKSLAARGGRVVARSKGGSMSAGQ
ncbi:hypothetical protein FA95DRAFT_1607163 [Auriscalpium vulgare]|uniref:Uncharacterized protein n=1 Tax=Auriscalpium vulgare TaxID=40419 RepID=A0ACB8RPJ8_9AGAM|nr:hypothetical protein FA95DRAFT_1607163 [Auriscalpium vulgare]